MDYKKSIIFCDFDGTITTRDTIDHLLELYADPNWEVIEEEWKNGKIGSRECLERQINCIDTFNNFDLENFLNKIEIDNNFISFYQKVLELKVPFFIISDGFNLIIENVFKKFNLPTPIIYSNELKIIENKLIPHFPRSMPELCLVKAGMCKCSVIEKENKEIYYIGDGRSDFCASRLANVLYAKGSLQKLCQEVGRSYIPFSDFGSISKNLFNFEEI